MGKTRDLRASLKKNLVMNQVLQHELTSLQKQLEYIKVACSDD